eukprot:315720-Rhodomonas_salina.1
MHPQVRHHRQRGASTYAPPTESPVLICGMLLPDLLAHALVQAQDQVQTTVAISLRACYAMSGTDLDCGAIGLRACYAMSGTDLAYGATSALNATQNFQAALHFSWACSLHFSDIASILSDHASILGGFADIYDAFSRPSARLCSSSTRIALPYRPAAVHDVRY